MVLLGIHTLITLQSDLSAETTAMLSLHGALTVRVCAHTLPCQSILSDWQLFLQSCLLFCLLLSCLSHTRLSLMPSLPFMGRELFPHLKLL